jgi:hypothetical protein
LLGWNGVMYYAKEIPSTNATPSVKTINSTGTHGRAGSDSGETTRSRDHVRSISFSQTTTFPLVALVRRMDAMPSDGSTQCLVPETDGRLVHASSQ